MKGIKEAKEIIKKGKIKRISERMWEILPFDNHEGHIVQEVVKQGRSLVLCDCINHTEYASFRAEPSICTHKKAVIIMEAFK
jgi:hypothetical protein